MNLADVLALLADIDERGIDVWLDGGWGVDCLLGGQSRVHSDLDLVVPRAGLEGVRSLLASQGFVVIRDWLPTSIAFRDGAGREVDLHPVMATADGGGDQVLQDGSLWRYAPPVEGSLSGRRIRCASAEAQLAMHQGYEPRPVDLLDVQKLVERFQLPWPDE